MRSRYFPDAKYQTSIFRKKYCVCIVATRLMHNKVPVFLTKYRMRCFKSWKLLCNLTFIKDIFRVICSTTILGAEWDLRLKKLLLLYHFGTKICFLFGFFDALTRLIDLTVEGKCMSPDFNIRVQHHRYLNE